MNSQSYFFPTIITNITSLNGGLYGTVKPTDVYPAVDVTDLSQSPQGTTKPYQIIQLFNYIMTNFGYIIYQPVLAATTANLLATYDNGSSGVGATLTNSGTQGAFVLDGQNGVLGGRYLIKNQTLPAQNGIYTLTIVGNNTTNWVLTRSIDFNQSLNILEDGIVFVQFGITNGNTFWQDTFIFPITVGTTAINWAPWSFISGSGIVNAGLQNDLAYYATTGNAVSPLATANNGVLVTNSGGAPSISSTLPLAVQSNITQLGTQSQALNMGSHLINNVSNPVSAQDAATKAYVDSLVSPNPTITKLTSGSGTYTTPANCVRLHIRLVGGGAGGYGGGGGGVGAVGVDTTFGALTGGGATSISVGGTASGGNLINANGAPGGPRPNNLSGSFGGVGGSTPFGAGGIWGDNGPTAGGDAQTNSGAGGGGGGVGAGGTSSGVGGGAGGYVEHIQNSPAATYSYSVGTGGAKGTAGTGGSAGGNGAAGQILIIEYYA